MKKELILKAGREKSLLRRHPWIFTGAVAQVTGSPEPGETIQIVSTGKKYLATAAYSPHSQIIARVWTFNANETIDYNYFLSRIQTACAIRRSLINPDITDSYRLVNSESDGLPGLIIDCYGSCLVIQLLSAGTELFRNTIVEVIKNIFPHHAVYERSDTDSRAKEGLSPVRGIVSGTISKPCCIKENSLLFTADIEEGHKTGFYLDQRGNRELVGKHTGGMDVLNCFSYTGGFTLYALRCGAAQVTNIDSSARALEIINRHVSINNFDTSRIENITGDVFSVLRTFRDTGREFDCIILDPPKFVDSRKNLKQGCRGYKDINLLAFKILRPGGLLFTFSCSSLVDMDLFQKIVSDAALDASRTAVILHKLGQSADHVTQLTFPEGWYLKGLMCRVE